MSNKNVESNREIPLENNEIIAVSLFENVFSKESHRKVSLEKFLFSKRYKDEIEEYRRCKDKKLRDKVKKSLPCITPSGTFTERKETRISNHTGLICIDIDSKDNEEIDLDKSKHIIGEDCPSLYYAGLSIGGEGIFLIFRISEPLYHTQHFNALVNYLEKRFELNVDKHVKSMGSLRVISYDENPYYNPHPAPFEHIMGTEDRIGYVSRTIAEKDAITKKVQRAVKIIMEKDIDITNGYENWFKIGCALAYEFGEDGREWFQIISSHYEEYYHSDCDSQYSRCLKYRDESKITIATFFHYCKMYGIRYQE